MFSASQAQDKYEKKNNFQNDSKRKKRTLL